MCIRDRYQTQDDAGYGRTHRVITEELPFRLGAEVGKLQFIFDQYLVEAGKRLFYLPLEFLSADTCRL